MGLVVVALGLMVGCDSAGVTCGPGTVLQGDTCVPVTGSADAGPSTPIPGSDAGGSTTPPPSGTDAGSPPPSGFDAGSTTTPPPSRDAGSNPPPLVPGCDMASGECDAWADSIYSLLASYDDRGCAETLLRSPQMDTVAARHAAHQASSDMLTTTSPDGDLAQQVNDAGEVVTFFGVLVSQGRIGPENTVDRWIANASTQEVLGQCWTKIGVAVATGPSGWSYTTVLLGDDAPRWDMR